MLGESLNISAMICAARADLADGPATPILRTGCRKPVDMSHTCTCPLSWAVTTCVLFCLWPLGGSKTPVPGDAEKGLLVSIALTASWELRCLMNSAGGRTVTKAFKILTALATPARKGESLSAKCCDALTSAHACFKEWMHLLAW